MLMEDIHALIGSKLVWNILRHFVFIVSPKLGKLNRRVGPITSERNQIEMPEITKKASIL